MVEGYKNVRGLLQLVTRVPGRDLILDLVTHHLPVDGGQMN